MATEDASCVRLCSEMRSVCSHRACRHTCQPKRRERTPPPNGEMEDHAPRERKSDAGKKRKSNKGRYNHHQKMETSHTCNPAYSYNLGFLPQLKNCLLSPVLVDLPCLQPRFEAFGSRLVALSLCRCRPAKSPRSTASLTSPMLSNVFVSSAGAARRKEHPASRVADFSNAFPFASTAWRKVSPLPTVLTFPVLSHVLGSIVPSASAAERKVSPLPRLLFQCFPIPLILQWPCPRCWCCLVKSVPTPALLIF